MAWGRATAGGAATNGATKAADDDGEKRVNVLATGSVDLTAKVWTP